MKMRSEIILFFWVTMGLMASTANETGKDGINRSLISSVISDTSISNRFIKVDSFNLSILPPSSGVQFYKDGIVFLSSSKSEEKMLPEHISFGKINARYAILNNSVLENPQLFSPSVNFSYPTEAFTFSNDFKTMYFTKYSEADGVEKIFQAKYSSGSGNQGDWSVDENPMSFCSGQYIYTHPALSADGKLMIFASNRPGSVGGMDLFASQEKGGKWSDPVNLGDAVNSISNELYPYLDSENNLFFSSDGIQGYGGYDIYVCKFKSNTWEKPINLSTPINTRFDDVAFTVNRKDGKSAFYTVKQKSGKRSLQLYKITMNSYSPDSLLTLSQFFTRPDISHMVILVSEPPVQATDRKTETARLKISETRGGKDIVIYRVQFLTSFNPRTRSKITVNGKDYSVFEYLYSGAYRLCVGEFSTLLPARELQSTLMQYDYPQALVVAFKNNVRSLDPELLKEQPVSEPVAAAVEKVISEPKKQVKPAETKVETIKKEIPETEAIKVETVKTTIPVPAEKKDIVVYRVQILTSSTAKGNYKITVGKKVYDTFEYFYTGAYRTCVGGFSTLAPAKELQNICRQSGYPQAFVVAFKNNVRSTDPALFK
jgi:hypothetical protein